MGKTREIARMRAGFEKSEGFETSSDVKKVRRCGDTRICVYSP
jgi:hypothetical protein